MCSYVEKYAEFKNQTLKKSAGTSAMRDGIHGGGWVGGGGGGGG